MPGARAGPSTRRRSGSRRTSATAPRTNKGPRCPPPLASSRRAPAPGPPVPLTLRRLRASLWTGAGRS
ncbi:hypothetical protein DQ237_00600 [Blastococcus sp. TF02-8]|nr:hypothetical protein DQ237_00600 [Blastococcus sp. TF02-8]